MCVLLRSLPVSVWAARGRSGDGAPHGQVSGGEDHGERSALMRKSGNVASSPELARWFVMESEKGVREARYG